MKNLLFLFCLLYHGQFLLAQTTEKSTNDLEIWTRLNTEYQLKGGSCIFGETNLRSIVGDTKSNLGFLPAYRVQQLLGYEQYLDKNWALGFSLRGVIEKPYNQLFSRLYVSHLSLLKGYEIQKVLAFERIDSENAAVQTESRVSILLGLAKEFTLPNKAKLRPMVAYQLFMNHQWILEANPLYINRGVDKTRLHIELAYLFNSKWAVSLYWIDQTDYFWVLGEYDAQRNQIKPDRNLNTTTPIIGVRLYWRLLNKNLADKIRTRFLSPL